MSRTAYFQLSQSSNLATRERVKIVTFFSFRRAQQKREKWEDGNGAPCTLLRRPRASGVLSWSSCRHKRSTHHPRDTNCCQLIHHGCISIKEIFVDFRKFFSRFFLLVRACPLRHYINFSHMPKTRQHSILCRFYVITTHRTILLHWPIRRRLSRLFSRCMFVPSVIPVTIASGDSTEQPSGIASSYDYDSATTNVKWNNYLAV